MLRIDSHAKAFVRVGQPTISEAGFKERDDIQQMIRNSPQAFFEELGEELLLLGAEIRPDSFVDDRIDLLAIDQQGAVVVLELKRGTHKLHLLQALAYAGMVSKWDRERLLSQRAGLMGKTLEEVEEEIEEFVLGDLAKLNQSQRVILVAGDFDYEVLITAEWLTEHYELDVRCYRLILSADGEREYLTCPCIYPPPELTEHVVRRKKVAEGPVRWGTWTEALDAVSNPAVVEFFRRELATGRENTLRKRTLRYLLDGKRRFFVHARQKNAYVWQRGRFADDEEFWKTRIGLHAGVQSVNDGRALRFYLETTQDFVRFSEAIHGDIRRMSFVDGAEIADEDGESEPVEGSPL
ncbi:MAG TPA: hypothetical protein VFL31_07110 [Nitrospiraceae bacterium]|nr:hypothetical protein [Nitrospiraceae bacterium]